jgi:hypothetical protein
VVAYSVEGTLLPRRRRRGIMAVADAPPYSSAETKDGKTLYDANSDGNDDAESLKVLCTCVNIRRENKERWLLQEGSLLNFVGQGEVIQPLTNLYERIVDVEASF